MKVLIIIPAYNEVDSLDSVVKHIKEYSDAEYLIIDDCSVDSTRAKCREKGYNYISLPLNLGIGGGVQAGYKYALENSYDIAIQHDGDGQHDPRFIEKVIQPIIENECDIAIGSRFLDDKGFKSSRSRRLGISFLSRLIYICSGGTGDRIKDVTSGFRAVNRKYIEFYSNNYPQDYPEPEAIISAKLNGARVKEISVQMRERENGESSITLKKSIYYMIKVSIAVLICRLTNYGPKLLK